MGVELPRGVLRALAMLGGLSLLSAGHGHAESSGTIAAPFIGWERMDANLKQAFAAAQNSARSRDQGRRELTHFYVKAAEPAVTAARLRQLGASVGTVAGDILTVRADVSGLPSLASLSTVSRLEGATRVRPLLDLAVLRMHANRVHQGVGLNQAYQGAGVLVGVIDGGGLDYQHDAFKGEDGQVRVVGLWDQYGKGTPPMPFDYGNYCDRESLSTGACELYSDPFGLFSPSLRHGTHVTGVAVGGRVGSQPYVGLAPKAEILFVSARESSQTPWSTHICDGANWLIQQAKKLGQPLVINMSLGDTQGPHDGQSLANQCLDNLVTEAGPGHIMVAAAGNEGAGSHHGETPVYGHATGKANLEPHIFQFHSGRGARQNVSLYSYNPTELSLRVGLDLSSGAIWTPRLSKDTQLDRFPLLGPDASLPPGYVSAFSGSASGSTQFSITVTTKSDASWLLEVTAAHGGGGRDAVYDAFIDTTHGGGFIQADASAETAVNNQMTIGYPADSPKVLAVGAYVSRTSWVDSEGATVDAAGDPILGDLSDSSSRGPSRNVSVTGLLPDVTAPGRAVIAALADGAFIADKKKVVVNSPNGFISLSGTSMASPAVAGAVALMLEARPTLNIEELREVIRETALPPPASSANPVVPNNDWGFGKFNAQAAMLAVGAGASEGGTGGGSGSGGSAGAQIGGSGGISEDTSSGARQGDGALSRSGTCAAAVVSGRRFTGHAGWGALVMAFLMGRVRRGRAQVPR